MDPSRGDSRYNLNYSMSSIGLSLADQADMYGNPAAVAALGGRPPSGGLLHTMSGNSSIGFSGRSGSLIPSTTQCQSIANSSSINVGGTNQQRGIKRAGSDCYDEHHRGSASGMSSQSLQGLDSCGGGGSSQQTSQQQGNSSNVSDVVDDSYNALQNKKSPPANGKKTKGRVKIKMEYIDNKLRRYTTFSKRKTGIMKKAYELSTLTGTQVMLLVASETGHVYTFATRKLQPMITSEAGKQLIQTCLNSPDPPSVGGGDQRMSATGFEETELSYNIADEDSKDDRLPLSSANESEDSSDIDSPSPAVNNNKLATVEVPQNSGGHTVTESPLTYGKSCNERVQYERQLHTPITAEEITNINSSNITTVNTTEQSNDEYGARAATKSATPSTTVNNLLYPTSSLSNIPQDILLQLIQSGHLQLHTEEDGSGHQYVAIPLSASTANLIKTSKSITLNSTSANNQSTTEKESSCLPKPQQIAKALNANISGVMIKQELE